MLIYRPSIVPENPGRIAQRESVPFTRERSKVRSLVRPPLSFHIQLLNGSIPLKYAPKKPAHNRGTYSTSHRGCHEDRQVIRCRPLPRYIVAMATLHGTQNAKGDPSGSRASTSQASVVAGARNTRFLRLIERVAPRLAA